MKALLPGPVAGSRLPDGASLYRRVTVAPSMCGQGSLFQGRVGDWTWETVSAACNIDVFRARNGAGAPTYLAFYYFFHKASPLLDPRRLSFGDRLEVASSAFRFGSESILTLHKIGRAGRGDCLASPVDPEEFFDRPREEFLYVGNFNRWLTRSRPGSNQELQSSAPAGFQYAHLPALPERYSPRRATWQARTQLSFREGRSEGYVPGVRGFTTEYPIDLTRDINGVGLIYFAAYFSIIDTALWRLWRHLGRGDRSFLERVVLDHKLCYLANPEADAVLRIETSSWRSTDHPGREVFDVVLRDRDGSRVIAVSTLNLFSEAEHGRCHDGMRCRDRS